MNIYVSFFIKLFQLLLLFEFLNDCYICRIHGSEIHFSKKTHKITWIAAINSGQLWVNIFVVFDIISPLDRVHSSNGIFFQM